MTNVTSITPESAIATARKEVAEENQKKAVKLLKAKLREEESAKTILANVQREIADLVQSIEDGNF